MPSINWSTKVISVAQSELTPISAGLFELDVNAFRLDLKDIEDGEEGMGFPDTHRHSTEVVLSGVTYARTFEIINGYTVEFENGSYTVRCIGANHNLADVKAANSVSLIIGNSAGLISVDNGGTAASIAAAVWQRAIENSTTAEELLRAIIALSAAKATGGGTNTIEFNSLDGTKTRLRLNITDADGNRNNPTIVDLT